MPLLPTFVADPNPEFLAKLKTDPAASLAPPVFAASGSQAQSLLPDPAQKFRGIFINPEISYPSGLSVLRCAHLHHVGTPIFLICDGEAAPLPASELRRLAIHQALRKPLTYSEMLAYVAPIIPEFDATAALEAARTNHDPLDRELMLEDSEFTSIRADNFLSGRISFFDVYVKVGNERYLKLLQAGDAFSADRIASYLKKGVLTMYVRKEAHANYVAYCDHLASSLASRQQAPAALRLAQTMNAGEETLKFLRGRNVRPADLEYATRFASNVQRLITTLKQHEHPAVHDFLRDAASYEHGVGAAIVAGILLRPLSMDSGSLQRTVGLAALFHDIGLQKTAPKLEEKEESEMTQTELRLYYTHPEEGVRLLSQIDGINPIALQAIGQHHERRSGKGFPRKTKPGTISLVAEIVGIGDEFMRALQRSRLDPRINPIQYMHDRVFDGFSYGVIKAFADTLEIK